ncbi:hypothetical protein EHV23_04940 [Lautropia dentalis]|uniref:Uncharacterized protein n=1 Tax=Lautropia dentalis TaxID=2490857 RepID=A0A426FS47_9BURK|nr:hypothetical protein [Lautropia dentalis]RRN45532.1 hypothetical protein EHV23_04940 [Lautropia dentalis]
MPVHLVVSFRRGWKTVVPAVSVWCDGRKIIRLPDTRTQGKGARTVRCLINVRHAAAVYVLRGMKTTKKAKNFLL